jgi:SAM-dependent methyltransferase
MNLGYYLWSSYRRKALDRLQERYSHLYEGIVLDIGGRDRGRFEKPKKRVKRWIFADVNEAHEPDVVLDVAEMGSTFADNSIDIVNAMELFEHVERIEKGLNECYRVLKDQGRMILSAPFLYPVHGDPFDFQRWTGEKWRNALESIGFRIEHLEVTGGFFSVLGDMVKTLVHTFPFPVNRVCQLFYPILDLVVLLDRSSLANVNPKIKGYQGGYFIVTVKDGGRDSFPLSINRDPF